jgi:hypothetical protein
VSCRYGGKIGLTEARINAVEKHFAVLPSHRRVGAILPFYVN